MFKSVSIPNSANKHELLYCLFTQRFKCFEGEEASADINNVGIVQECVEDMKKGKAAGLDGLMAEHIVMHMQSYWST